MLLCVNITRYKVVAEALRVVGAIVRVIRPSSGSSGADDGDGDGDGDGDVAMAATMSDDFDVSPFVSELHDAVLPRLQVTLYASAIRIDCLSAYVSIQ
jgi:hypothetical protein